MASSINFNVPFECNANGCDLHLAQQVMTGQEKQLQECGETITDLETQLEGIEATNATRYKELYAKLAERDRHIDDREGSCQRRGRRILELEGSLNVRDERINGYKATIQAT